MPRQRDVAASQASTADSQGSQRIDKWLWFARVVKSRTLATGLVQDGKVRINRERTDKPSQPVRPGDVITLTVHRQVKVLKVLDPGMRRGPAKEAVLLYEDLSPPKPQGSKAEADAAAEDGRVTFEAGSGRPTKKDRRAIDKLRDQSD